MEESQIFKKSHVIVIMPTSSGHLSITGRIAAKRQTVGIKFTQRTKINVFAPQGRVIAPIYMKFGTAEEHVFPLARAKFFALGWVHGPKS